MPRAVAKRATRRATGKGKLAPYRRKRDFARTPEPEPSGVVTGGDRFVVQKHGARSLHYDLRLEIGGVLKSWAVTKGPSLDPKVRRLAVHVEDHPLDYANFEGNIPKGQYGGGPVMVWDHGAWVPMADVEASYREGQIKFRLDGQKLKGGWTLVRLKGGDDLEGKGWLLIKERDIHAHAEAEGIITEDECLSVLSARSLEEIAAEAMRSAPAPEPERRRGSRPRRATRVAAAKIVGARETSLPSRPRPQLASLAATPPDGGEWVHEIKYDGYRTLARIADGDVRLFTRHGHDWTERYAPIARALGELTCPSAVIDGEVCVQAAGGATSFAALQDALAEGIGHELVYFCFDLLYLDGHDLSRSPLIARKKALAALLDPVLGDDSAVHFSEHIAGRGAAFLDQAQRLGLEGIVSKKAKSGYKPGRSKGWLKVKCAARGDFVIVGYAESAAAGGLSALLLAEPFGQGLRYVGRVGTGFSAREAKRLRDELRPLGCENPVFTLQGMEDTRRASWVEPRRLADVEYATRTGEGRLRAARYKGLRPAVARAPHARPHLGSHPSHVSDADLAAIWITNPDRRMFGADGPTKLDLALYYAKVAAWMVPEVVQRPLTLVRCPSGKLDDVFYQRHATAGMPDHVRRIPLHDDGAEKREDFIFIADAKGLFTLAQFGGVEFHPWGCRVDKPERPDRIIIDLDPDEGLDWRVVVAAAHDVREQLDRLGLPGFVRTTGGKGLHVVVPLQRRHGWATVKAAAHGFVLRLAARQPRRYTASPAKAARRGRVYADYLRNGRGATAVGSYSLRARAGAPVATPLSWRELDDLDDPRELDWRTVPDRLGGLAADPWEGLSMAAVRLTRKLERKLGINKRLGDGVRVKS